MNASVDRSPEGSSPVGVQFGLIIVGDEILSGKRQDKHLPKVIELLSARGLSLSWCTVVGDERPRIIETLRSAFASADVVFCCGGIGATPDDHTRQAAAAALNVPLELHPEARELIWQRVQAMAPDQAWRNDPKHPEMVHRLNMGVFPQGAQIVPNPYNQIPGFSCRGPGGAQVFFVPGFPVMAHPMIEAMLDAHRAQWQQKGHWREQSVVVYGSAEASLTPLMEHIEKQHTVKVFSLPSVDHPEHGRHIELGVKGEGHAVDRAFAELLAALQAQGAPLGPQISR